MAKATVDGGYEGQLRLETTDMQSWSCAGRPLTQKNPPFSLSHRPYQVCFKPSLSVSIVTNSTTVEEIATQNMSTLTKVKTRKGKVQGFANCYHPSQKIFPRTMLPTTLSKPGGQESLLSEFHSLALCW